jgi:uronate dehydrogenase
MKILLTGATGLVGTDLRPYLSETYDEILLTSRSPVADLRSNERHEAGDIADSGFVASLVEQVDGIIHLAGAVGPDYTFEEVMGPNVVGTYNVLNSARNLGVRQIIYASSHHAVGFLPRGAVIDSRTQPRADSFYGVSKAFGEVLASYFSDKFALNIMAVRIGYVGEQAVDERRMHTWCSPRDLAQLIHLGLSNTKLGYRLVYGVSDNPGGFFDNSEAENLGYRPRDNSLNFLADPKLRDAEPDPNSAEDRFVGGYFASRGMSQEAVAGLISMYNEDLK